VVLSSGLTCVLSFALTAGPRDALRACPCRSWSPPTGWPAAALPR